MVIDNQVMTAIISAIGGIFAGLIIGIPALMTALARMFNLNSEKSVNYTKSAEQIASACDKLRTDMERQIEALDKQIKSDREYNLELEKRLDQNEEEIMHLRRDNERLQDGIERIQRWAARLVTQVKDLGGRPVQLEEIDEMPKRRITDMQT